MKFEAFAAGQGPEYPNEEPLDESQREFIDDSRQWARYFADELHTFMLNDGTQENPKQFHGQILKYRMWSERSLPYVLSTLSSEQQSGNDRVLNELSFHRLNTAMLPGWIRLAYPELQLPKDTLETIQTDLAIDGARIAIMKKRQLAKLSSAEDTTEAIDKMGGIQTEIDAAIVMSEIMKSNPQLVVLPSPAQFERGHRVSSSNRNSDFVALDMDTHHAHGYNVKQGSYADHSYDTDFVTIISGVNHMENFETVRMVQKDRFNHAHLNYVQVPKPGLIALDHFRSLPIKQTPRTLLNKEYLQLRLAAREFDYPARFPDAVKAVGAIVLRTVNRAYTTPESMPTAS